MSKDSIIYHALQKRSAIDISKSVKYSEVDTLVKNELYKPSFKYTIPSSIGSGRRCSFFGKRTADEIMAPVSDF